MPYTFVHPGYILPFVKRLTKYLSLSALIIGSFVPDLDILYRFSETRQHLFDFSNHTIMFVYVPMGIVLTYFMSEILIPISKSGELPQVHKDYFLNKVLELPKITGSLILAILLHRFLDGYTHLSNAKELSLALGADLGYEPDETLFLYLFLMYLPQIITSFIGLILCLISVYVYKNELRENTAFLRQHKFSTILLSAFILVTFTSMKVIKAGIETGMEFDSIIIGVSTGLMSVFLLAPLALYLYLRTVGNRSVLLSLIFIFSLYMFGMVYKEYLSIYILKGLFIAFSSFLSLIILQNSHLSLKLILVLVLDFTLIFFHPFTAYFTYLLILKFFLSILFLFWSKRSILIHSVIKSLIYGVLFCLAFYASNKGLGPGLFVLFALAFSYEFSLYHKFDRLKNILMFFTMLFSCIIITSVHNTLGLMSFLFLFLFVVFRFYKPEAYMGRIYYSFFIGIIPLLAVVYIFTQFSRMYGVFSLAQIFLMLLLTYSEKMIEKESSHKNFS